MHCECYDAFLASEVYDTNDGTRQTTHVSVPLQLERRNPQPFLSNAEFHAQANSIRVLYGALREAFLAIFVLEFSGAFYVLVTSATPRLRASSFSRVSPVSLRVLYYTVHNDFSNVAFPFVTFRSQTSEKHQRTLLVVTGMADLPGRLTLPPRREHSFLNIPFLLLCPFPPR